VYNAEPPEKLEVFMKNQEKELERQKGLLEDVIGSLKSSYQLALHRPGVRFFEGKEGMAKALYDTYTAKETIYTYADADSIILYAGGLNKEYVKKRESLKKYKKILVVDTPIVRSYIKNHYSKYTEFRLLPLKMRSPHTTLQIYDGKVLYLPARKDNLIGVIIEDQDIYQFHRQLFESWWENAPQFTSESQSEEVLGTSLSPTNSKT
jgi:hypothetical protein